MGSKLPVAHDSSSVIFGAPVSQGNDARRAVACAVAMQQAMAQVNAENRREGLPEVEMGIGVHSGEVVVGNIGSYRRTKYGVVGSTVNLTSRIESYTVGGQILISDATLQESGPILSIKQQIEVEAKGFGKPFAVHDVRGIAGERQLFLPDQDEEFFSLSWEIPLRYTVIEGKHLGGRVFEGHFVKLSTKGGEIRSETPAPLLSNIKMQILGGNGKALLEDVYGKVLGHLSDEYGGFSVRFTSVPSEASLFRLLRRQH